MLQKAKMRMAACLAALLVVAVTLSQVSATEPEVVTYDSLTECNVTVTSISPWPVGACGQRTSADPRVFGPEAWRSFHR